MEPSRISCSIVGCRRTSKRRPEWIEWLCQRHYRCDADLNRAHKTAKRRRQRIERHFKRWVYPGSIVRVSAKGERILYLAKCRAHATFDVIKQRAQAMQDAGFWQRPVKRRVGSRAKSKVSAQACRFEDQFQRLKRAHAEGLL